MCNCQINIHNIPILNRHFEKEKMGVTITSQCAIVEGELQLPLRDLCDERVSKNTNEVAGICSNQALPHIPLYVV